MGISWSSALQNHSDIVRSQVGFLSLLCLLGLGKVEHLLLYCFGSGLSGNSSFLFFLDRIQRNCCFSPLTALTLHQDLKNLLVPQKGELALAPGLAFNKPYSAVTPLGSPGIKLLRHLSEGPVFPRYSSRTNRSHG